MESAAAVSPSKGAHKNKSKQKENAPLEFSPMQMEQGMVALKSSCSCGGGCPTCQAKSSNPSSNLKISQPNDPTEIEADHIAEKVMRVPADQSHQKDGSKTASTKNHTHANFIHRKCNACDEEDAMKIQRKPIPSADVPSQSPAHVSNAVSAGGDPLDGGSRSFFEPRLGYDLSSVRIHTDSTAAESARAIDAKAYTIGNNIVFGKGEYQPDNQSGKHLLAHELAHVTQSANGSAQINRNTIYRQPAAAAANERILLGLPKGGLSLKSTPEHKKDNNLPAALVENGDKIVVKNDNVKNIPSVKNGTWAWIDVPGKTSPQKDYPVMHGFIETKYFNEVPRAEAVPDQGAASPQPQQAVEPKKNPFGPSMLSDKELEYEINLMRAWLTEHTDAKVAENLAVYEAEAGERINKERKAAEAANPPAAAAEPEADIGDLESALYTLKNGVYVSPMDQGAGDGSRAEGPTDTANSALNSVDEKFLVPATDEMADNPVLRLEASIKQLEIRIAKQKQSIAGWSSEAKLKKAVESAIGQLGGELGERLKELLTPESLAIMAAFVIAYVVSQTTPIGWLADILIAGMIAATILMVGSEAIEIVKLLIQFVDKAESAKSQADIDAAGKALATAITKAGVDVILAILLHKAGKSANLKPPSPRSPGIVDFMKKGGGMEQTTISEPATTGIRVGADGTCTIDLYNPFKNMSMMEAPQGPKSSGGSGKGSGAPKAGGEPAKPTPGQDLSASGGLPKKPVADAIKGKKPPVETEPGKSPAAEDPAAKSKAADKPTDTPAKDAAASKGVPVEIDPQQGVKSALERINKKIADAQAEMADKGKEVTKVSQEEWALRQKLKNTSASDPGRPKMLEELKAKQEQLKELQEQQKHRQDLNNLDIETRTRLKNALEAKTYARPGFTEAERAAIWEQAKTEGGGKVTSPSGVEIKPGDPWEVGHKPKYEFWKHVQSAAERGISREQFLRECKDLKKYRPETKADNSSHAFEDKTDAYLGE